MDTAIIQRTEERLAKGNFLTKILSLLVKGETPSEEEVDAILESLIRKVVETVGAESVTLYLMGSDNLISIKNVYYSASLYRGDPAKKKAFQDKVSMLKKLKLNQGQGMVGHVIESGTAYMVRDAQSDPNFYNAIDKELNFVTRSVITVPLVSDKPIGAIQVINKSGDKLFSREDQILLEKVSSYSGKVIEKITNPDVKFDDSEVARYLANMMNYEYCELPPDFMPDDQLVKIIGPEILAQTRAIPLEKMNMNSLMVAVSDPYEFFSKQAIFEQATGMRAAKVVVIPVSALDGILKQIVGDNKPDHEAPTWDASDFEEEQEDVQTIDLDDDVDENTAPIIKLANEIIEDAYVRGASDIHIEPLEQEVRVRYRVDGVCQVNLVLPKTAARPLIARLKVMSRMKIEESRLPQDGRIVFKEYNKKVDIDLRVSSAPLKDGEKVCMRILDKQKSTLPLDKLGFSEHNMKLYREAFRSPYGMVLNVGPTGSGKSMTLYSALNEINSPDINIQTAEDPIEYTIKGLCQMQMHKDIGLTFATALRCFLRQDPDVILVGEIRDKETAEIASEAALTGHLLFSTLHTNDASSTVSRMVDMGLEPFLISSTLLCVCAQRLMRRLCSKCKRPKENFEEWEIKIVERDKYPDDVIYEAVGCTECSGSGYKGRVGTHELMNPDDDMRRLINDGATTEDIKAMAVKGTMVTLHKDSMLKVRWGITDITEALRVVMPD
jgi:type IV pilus assembly protein PilB